MASMCLPCHVHFHADFQDFDVSAIIRIHDVGDSSYTIWFEHFWDTLQVFQLSQVNGEHFSSTDVLLLLLLGKV
jgi:hypothetical protein